MAVTNFLTVLPKVKCKIQIKFDRVINEFVKVYRSASDLTQLTNSPATGVLREIGQPFGDVDVRGPRRREALETIIKFHDPGYQEFFVVLDGFGSECLVPGHAHNSMVCSVPGGDECVKRSGPIRECAAVPLCK